MTKSSWILFALVLTMTSWHAGFALTVCPPAQFYHNKREACVPDCVELDKYIIAPDRNDSIGNMTSWTDVFESLLRSFVVLPPREPQSLCYPLSEMFKLCGVRQRSVYDHFLIDPVTKDAIIRKHGSNETTRVRLGMFSLFPDKNGTQLETCQPTWGFGDCMDTTIHKDYFTLDKKEVVRTFNKTFKPDSYFLSDDNRTVSVCFPFGVEIKSCDRWGYLKDEVAILPNFSIRIKDVSRVYDLGDYVIKQDGGVVTCKEYFASEVVVEDLFEALSVCWIISLVFLALSFVVNCILPKMNIHKITIQCLTVALFGTYLCLVIARYNKPGISVGLCLALALAQSYFFLSSFFWLNVLAFDIWYTFLPMKRSTIAQLVEKHRLSLYVVYAWGIPFLITATAFVIDQLPDDSGLVKPHFVAQCWYNGLEAIFVYAYGFVICILLTNIVFFVVTVINIRDAGKDAAFANSKVHNQLFWVYIRLFFVMGFCWILEVFSLIYGYDYRAVFTIVDAINALQGLYIFMAYICKRTVLLELAETKPVRALLVRTNMAPKNRSLRKLTSTSSRFTVSTSSALDDSHKKIANSASTMTCVSAASTVADCKRSADRDKSADLNNRHRQVANSVSADSCVSINEEGEGKKEQASNGH